MSITSFFKNRSLQDYVLLGVAVYVPLIVVISVFVALNSSDLPAVTDGLTAHWSFRSNLGHNARDNIGASSGYIHDASWTRGRGYLALKLDGKETYVEISQNSSNEILTRDKFTVSAWIKPEENKRSILFQKASESNQYPPLTIYAPWSKRLAIVFSNEDRRVGFLSDSNLDIGKWQHVVLSANLNSGSIEYFIDGESAGTDETTIKFAPGKGHIYLGTGQFEKEKLFFYEGQIDTVSLYDRILTEEEVEELAGE